MRKARRLSVQVVASVQRRARVASSRSTSASSNFWFSARCRAYRAAAVPKGHAHPIRNRTKRPFKFIYRPHIIRAMLPHGQQELEDLAASCTILPGKPLQGWHIDTWEMTDQDLQLAVKVYEAILLGGVDEDLHELLTAGGVDITGLLLDEQGSKDDITRSDVTELCAAATLLAADGCEIESLHLPNVPKMSRRKSDSGIDVMVPTLVDSEEAELIDGERLIIVSVKHSVQASTSSVRSKLVTSLSSSELSNAYVATQLRVLNGRLIQQGVSATEAKRVYLFLRSFPGDGVELIAVAAVDSSLKNELSRGLKYLPPASGEHRTFRGILIDEIASLHERCP